MANMNTMGYTGGGVECGMMNAAIHQLAARIGVPNYNSAGLSDAKLPDAQAGWEKAMTILLGAMGGSNYLHHSAGMLESMLTVAPYQYVIYDEIIGMACKVLCGITVDEEHLAVDVIDQVGPGGNFMLAPHTLTHMRGEYVQGNGVTDRKNREKWAQDGAADARARAKTIARRLLEQDDQIYIPAEVDGHMRARFNILLRPGKRPLKGISAQRCQPRSSSKMPRQADKRHSHRR
jgi:trimethylamine--corrinoid protein Co-methyltransferase